MSVRLRRGGHCQPPGREGGRRVSEYERERDRERGREGERGRRTRQTI